MLVRDVALVTHDQGDAGPIDASGFIFGDELVEAFGSGATGERDAACSSGGDAFRNGFDQPFGCRERNLFGVGFYDGLVIHKFIL